MASVKENALKQVTDIAYFRAVSSTGESCIITKEDMVKVLTELLPLATRSTSGKMPSKSVPFYAETQCVKISSGNIWANNGLIQMMCYIGGRNHIADIYLNVYTADVRYFGDDLVSYKRVGDDLYISASDSDAAYAIDTSLCRGVLNVEPITLTEYNAATGTAIPPVAY